ncbi:MAG TPA: prephenate dehydrogenase/arogenate dehydrogenase family protein [Anaerolineales bacterium]|nr:prephenate dehydrogenase/arogenate dehydrogenase family protein [Anaerolineales bacterium]
MAVQITIVGLGQIGTSVGLALAEQSELIYRMGHDRELRAARHAEKLGALDKVSINLISAVEEADLVLLALPIDQIQETLGFIRNDLKPAAVVMDTGPVKQIVASWAAELLPDERYYVGLTPVLNPVYLHEIDSGAEAAHPDLFRDGLIGIVSPPGTPSEAIKLAADLTRLLGATPLFADPLEMDGLVAATHILPQLMAAALLNATVDQPGWLEGRKIAGRSYAEVTAPVMYPTEPSTLTTAAMLNRENVIRVLDGAMASINAIRNDLINEEEKLLEERLNRAREGRKAWLNGRWVANWAADETTRVEAPTASDIFGRFIGRGKKKED